MSWVRIDDQFADHPKFLAISEEGLALWVRGLAYCNRHLTDGVIPDAALGILSRAKRPSDIASQLVTAGLWTRIERGYLVHDFLQWNPSKADVLATRESKKVKCSEAGKRGASKRWNGAKDRVDPITDAIPKNGPNPIRSDPICVTREGSETEPISPEASDILARLQSHLPVLANVANLETAERYAGLLLQGRQLKDILEAIDTAATELAVKRDGGEHLGPGQVASYVWAVIRNERSSRRVPKQEPETPTYKITRPFKYT